MLVDKENFIAVVNDLKKNRVIVLDREIIDGTGVSKGNLSSYLSGRLPPSKNFLEKFYAQYGKHIKTNVLSEPRPQYGNATAIDLGDKLVMQVPLVGQHAYAGYITGFADPEYVEQLSTVPFIVEKEPRGKYVAFEVSGNSMDDGSSESYLPGDILLCREIKRELWQSKLHIKKWDFVVVHKSLGVQIKRITKHDTDKGKLTLHPLNNDYNDSTVNVDDVMQILNVVQVMRKK